MRTNSLADSDPHQCTQSLNDPQNFDDRNWHRLTAAIIICPIAYNMFFLLFILCTVLYIVCSTFRWIKFNIRSLASLCLSSLLRSQFWIEFDNTLHGRLAGKLASSLGVKTRKCLPVFTPNFHQVSQLLMRYQWDGPNTAVLTPVDRLWG